MTENLSHVGKNLYSRTWKSVESVQKYANSRYRGLDQYLVSRRELCIVRQLLSIAKSPDRTLLDTPSGYGRFTRVFLDRDFDITSADLNLYVLQYQRRLFVDISNPVVANVLNLPFGSERFYTVFNFRLLQHFSSEKKRLRTLNELYRVSKKWVIVSVYIKSSVHALIKKASTHKGMITMIDFVLWEREIKSAGFKIVAFRRVLPLMHAQTIFLLEKSSR